MANTLDEIHREAWEERQKAPVMNDPTIATPGTFDEVKDDVREGLDAEVDARFSPATLRAESSEDSAWNPNATQETVDEDGEVQDPVGGPAGDDIDTSDDDAEDVADEPSVDSAYDPVTTTNDIRLDAPEGEDVDTEGATPEEDVDEALEGWEDDDGEVDDLESKTKAELLEEAAARDIEGRSSMNKAELVEALRN